MSLKMLTKSPFCFFIPSNHRKDDFNEIVGLLWIMLL